MHVLGIADGPDASAALCIDDRLVSCEKQASFDARTRSRAFPWDAAIDVLRRAGTSRSQVGTIAIAGRFTPPLVLRKRPALRRLAASSFSSALDLGVFYQAMLRQSGMGALQADNAADWLAAKLGTRGFRGRLELVDIHTALANAVYRFQPGDDVLICTLHPLGDGVSLAFHRAAYGQVDRVFDQKGFGTLHLHLHRCAETLGCYDLADLWNLAGDAEPDEGTLKALYPLLHRDHDRLSRAPYPLPTQKSAYQPLTRVPRDVAAASVRENLRQAVCQVIQHHLGRHDTRRVLLGGEGFHDPALVHAVRQLPGVEWVWSLPDPGYGALAVGAAAYAAGLPMEGIDPVAKDPEVRAQPDEQALHQALRQGRPVVRFSGHSVLDRFPTGDRCVWKLHTTHCTADERLAGGGGAHGVRPRAGSLLEGAVQAHGPIHLSPLVFHGKPVHRLHQARELASSIGAYVCAG